MNPILTLVTVVVLAFVLGRALTPYTSRAFGSSHVEFLLVGVLIGPVMPWELFDAELLTSFRPFVSLLLGLLAFMVGLRLRKALIDFETFSAGIFASLGVVLAVGGATIGIVQFFTPAASDDLAPIVDMPLYFDGVRLWSVWISGDSLWLALVVGAAASASSSSILNWARLRGYGGDKTLNWVNSLATSSHVTAILVFGVALAGTQANSKASGLGLTVTEWAAISAGAGVVCGLLFGLFIGGEADDNRVQLATVGAVTFASGVGEALGVSPLFVNLTAGGIIGLTSNHAERVQEALESLRDPIIILLMIFAGAMWQVPPGWAWLLVGTYIVIRILARRLFTRLAVDAFSTVEMPHIRVGDALLSQGALAAAIVESFAQQAPQSAAVATTTVLVGVVVAQLIAPRALRNYLVDAGREVTESVAPAPEPEHAMFDDSPAESMLGLQDEIVEDVGHGDGHEADGDENAKHRGSGDAGTSSSNGGAKASDDAAAATKADTASEVNASSETAQAVPAKAQPPAQSQPPAKSQPAPESPKGASKAEGKAAASASASTPAAGSTSKTSTSGAAKSVAAVAAPSADAGKASAPSVAAKVPAASGASKVQGSAQGASARAKDATPAFAPPKVGPPPGAAKLPAAPTIGVSGPPLPSVPGFPRDDEDAPMERDATTAAAASSMPSSMQAPSAGARQGEKVGEGGHAAQGDAVAPEASEVPEISAAPRASEVPEISDAPEASEVPEVELTPEQRLQAATVAAVQRAATAVHEAQRVAREAREVAAHNQRTLAAERARVEAEVAAEISGVQPSHPPEPSEAPAAEEAPAPVDAKQGAQTSDEAEPSTTGESTEDGEAQASPDVAERDENRSEG